MTHDLGTGTANLSVNLVRDEKALLGRLAFRAGAKSVGDFVRRLILAGLEVENPAAAAELREVRRRYYGTLCLVVFCGALAMGDHFELRRCRTRVEEVRSEEAA